MNIKSKKAETNSQQPIAAAFTPSHELASGTASFQFADHRPETISDDYFNPSGPIQKKENKTGLPDNLKAGIEHISGYSLDDVNVHYNSRKPAQLHAHAFAQGTDIHLASGQEHHLPHEAWHVVQQKQGRVQPTVQMHGKVNINDDEGLEKEADVMGRKAISVAGKSAQKPFNPTTNNSHRSSNKPLLQRVVLNGRTPLDRDALKAHFQIKDADEQSMMIIDALVKETKVFTLHDVANMLPVPYTPSGNRETALDNTGASGSHPIGFGSMEDFQLFILKVSKKMPVSDFKIIFHGSSLTGQSFKDKGGGSRLFDVGRESDYDVAIASPTLWERAIKIGVKIRGNHSEPLTPLQLNQLGLANAQQEAQFFASREVNFMLYQTTEEARKHEGPSLIAEQAEDYRETVGALHGDV